MTARVPARSRGDATRGRILDAAEKVMLDNGYAGVTSRSVAAQAGVPAPLIHYYFPTLDDLFIALLRRGAERTTERFLAATDSPEPLRALWELNLDPRGTSLTVELVALSNHREAVKTALVEISSQLQEAQIKVLAELFERLQIDTEAFPPELASIALGGIARMIVREQAMGVTTGHATALAAVDRFIDRLQAKKRRRAK